MAPIESTFTSDKQNLSELLSQIHHGKIQLPDFQRGWIWDEERIVDLIESISNSFPIGTIMLLQTGGKDITFKPRPIDGAPITGIKPEFLILDGQQRLTSLYQALFSNTIVKTKNARKKPIERWFYMDIQEALRVNGDRNETILSIPEDKKVKTYHNQITHDYSEKKSEYKHIIFPLNQVFDSSSWRWDFNTYWGHNPEKGLLFDKFERNILKRFQQYLVPVIIVKRETPKEAVCNVFEKVNTGGVSLTVFELLTATFAAENFSLRDDWEERRKRLKAHKVLGKLKNTDFLQTIALLVTYTNQLEAKNKGVPESELPGVSCKRKDILKLSVSDYKKWVDLVENGYKEVSKLLHREKIFSSRDLPYGTQVVPLAAVFAYLGKDAEPLHVYEKLSQWYWCGVLGELYGSAVESRFARDFPEIVNWIKGANPPKTIDDATFFSDRLYTLRTRNSAAYKGIHALLMKEGCLDFRTGLPIEDQVYFEERIDIHHIFPRNWCNQNNISTKIRDCVINKTGISAMTNRIISGKAPSEYLENLENKFKISSARMNDILVSHCIVPNDIRNNDFDGFIISRELQLVKIIEQAMGKSVVTEQLNSDMIQDEDYEGEEELEDEEE